MRRFFVGCWDVVVVLCFFVAFVGLTTCWKLLSKNGKDCVSRGFEKTIRTHLANAAASYRKTHPVQDDQAWVYAQAGNAPGGPATGANAN